MLLQVLLRIGSREGTIELVLADDKERVATMFFSKNADPGFEALGLSRLSNQVGC